MRLGLIGIAAAAAMALTAPVAMAADIPAPSYKAPVAAPPPLFSWTGFYLGVNAGYGWADASIGGVTISDDNLNGFVGGGQIGYNWQIGNFVLGIEGDIQGTTLGRSTTFIVPPVVTVDRDLNWFATVRGRAGLAFDRVMLYVTGGWAYVDYGVDVTVGALGLSADSSKSGWTVGGGVEWAFLPQWSVKFEYLYIDIDDVSIFPVAPLVVPLTVDAQLNVIRAGVNFRF